MLILFQQVFVELTVLNVAEAGTDRNEEAVGEPLIIVTRMDKYCFTVCIL